MLMEDKKDSLIGLQESSFGLEALKLTSQFMPQLTTDWDCFSRSDANLIFIKAIRFAIETGVNSCVISINIDSGTDDIEKGR